jgi:hypothetical protein
MCQSVAVALPDVFVPINLQYLPFTLLWGLGDSDSSGYFHNRDTLQKMANFKTLTFTARKWQLEYFVNFVWYMKAEPGKKKLLDIYPAYFYIFLPHYKSPSFITYTLPLWSYFFCLSKHSSCFSYSQVGWFYVLGSRVLLCLFSLESDAFQKY